MEILENFAGSKHGKFFGGVPDYVDVKKKPGWSHQPAPTAWDWVWNAITLRHIWGSPNLVWGSIALAFYFLFPYDLSPTGLAAQGPFTWAFFNARFPLWFAFTFGYNAFWHVTLYFLGWAKRPLLPNRTYNWDKLAHNVFWGTSGVVIWTLFDNVWAFLWATGRLPYMSDETAFSSWKGMAVFIGGFILTPLWREGHFYFAHRLLHFKPLYAMVHSLHHRNTDIEPFAGLCMHPVEHLYYYACVVPSLLPFLSPFHFVWNGMHLLLSPGASHSGWEDHMQSDQFHYFHHRYYECNYAGSGAGALDVLFNTYVGSYTDREKDFESVKQRDDAKSTLREIPAFDFVAYLALASACLFAWAYAATNPAALALAATYGVTKLHLALLAGFGPTIVALPWVTKAGGLDLTETKNAPFFHVLGGSAVCAAPIVYAAYLCF